MMTLPMTFIDVETNLSFRASILTNQLFLSITHPVREEGTHLHHLITKNEVMLQPQDQLQHEANDNCKVHVAEPREAWQGPP